MEKHCYAVMLWLLFDGQQTADQHQNASVCGKDNSFDGQYLYLQEFYIDFKGPHTLRSDGVPLSGGKSR